MVNKSTFKNAKENFTVYTFVKIATVRVPLTSAKGKRSLDASEAFAVSSAKAFGKGFMLHRAKMSATVHATICILEKFPSVQEYERHYFEFR